MYRHVSISRSITVKDLYEAIKICYPKALVDAQGASIVLDLSEKVKYVAYLQKSDVVLVYPKVFLFPTFEMKAKATEISMKLKNHLENVASIDKKEHILPDTCPTCKNPNTTKLKICEWCGGQI